LDSFIVNLKSRLATEAALPFPLTLDEQVLCVISEKGTAVAASVAIDLDLTVISLLR
jgi:hypothetical protein